MGDIDVTSTRPGGDVTATAQPEQIASFTIVTSPVELMPLHLPRPKGSQLGRAWFWLKETRGHGLWIAFWSIIGIGATLWSPLLIDHPFLLMLLAPRTAFVLLAAPGANLLWFVALGTVRLSMTDASWFMVGRRFPGKTILERAPSRFRPVRFMMRGTNRLCSWLCGRRLLAGLVLFLRPNARYLGVAGAYGVCPRLAAVTSVFGTVAYLAAVHQGLGLIVG